MPQFCLRLRMCSWLTQTFVVAALAWPMTAAAQSAGQWKGAEHIYNGTCAYCHETQVAPRLFGRQLTTQYVRHVIQSGLGAMPAFRPTDFTSDELDALARMIATRAGPPGSSSAQHGQTRSPL